MVREINTDIINYTNINILPRYLSFDKAHSSEHVNKVISNSIEIAQEYEVNIDMVYVIAAYHDVGLEHGRENHEKNSAKALLCDNNLLKWFRHHQIATMAEAVEDHRASNGYEPRSICGCIISEADRDIDYMTILKRTIQYSLSKFPEYNYEKHFDRTYEHIVEKYGEGGYLKLWLKTERNETNLKYLRDRIVSKESFLSDFDDMFKMCIIDDATQ